jgi:hypothetical protein
MKSIGTTLALSAVAITVAFVGPAFAAKKAPHQATQEWTTQQGSGSDIMPGYNSQGAVIPIPNSDRVGR